MTQPELCDRLVLLLIGGMSTSAAEKWCAEQARIDLAQAAELVKSARAKITVAANYSRDEQLGLAIMRCDSLYAKASTAGDLKTALQAQRELNTLMGLKTAPVVPVPGVEDDGSEASLEIVRSHLMPLRLAPETLPIEEHARLAAQFVRQRQAE